MEKPSVHALILEIDVYQAADEMAQGSMEDELLGTEGFLDDEDLYVTEAKLHPDAQIVYDRWYSYYMEIMERAKV